MIILDTNVLSELMKSQPDPAVVEWVNAQAEPELFTTSITEAEIFLGVELLSRGKRRDALLAAAERVFAADLEGRILGFESESARAFSKITAHRRRLGKPISQADAQIAAIAQVRRARLATRDTADFLDCGLDVIDPWKGS
jgi:predicted nucleic acid-binding protein